MKSFGGSARAPLMKKRLQYLRRICSGAAKSGQLHTVVTELGCRIKIDTLNEA